MGSAWVADILNNLGRRAFQKTVFLALVAQPGRAIASYTKEVWTAIGRGIESRPGLCVYHAKNLEFPNS
jgi:hypothetical protein